MNAETAERIRAVAAEMGYRTNCLARALPTGRTSMPALVTSDVTNPSYAEIIRGAEAAVAEADNTILLIDAQEDDRIERKNIERALLSVEGIAPAGTRMSDSAIRMVAEQRAHGRTQPGHHRRVEHRHRQPARRAPDRGPPARARAPGGDVRRGSGVLLGGRDAPARPAEAAGAVLRTQRLGPVPPTITGGAQAQADVVRGAALPAATRSARGTPPGPVRAAVRAQKLGLRSPHILSKHRKPCQSC
ncbi:hypothetical protein [Streptomyces sp. NPDC088812]|uniref:hypothetical protein n=1 Tax=Streptomyces sp. NPDC088812 TaxID=3365905 RepID=UPI0038167B24